MVNKTLENLIEQITEDNKHPFIDDIIIIKNYEGIANTAKELIDFIINKYDIKSYEEFTCPIHKKLAIQLKVFGK